MHVGRRIDVGRALLDGEQQLGLGHTLRADICHSLDLGETRPLTEKRDLERQSIPRQHLPPELRVVDAAQRHARGRRHATLLEDQHRGELRERLDRQDRGHDRRARKVSLKEVFVDREIFEGREPAARLMLPDRVDQE